jgi:large repetitive protein
VITAPNPLIVTANITASAKCSVGATIEASATGGTPAYRYELWDATATTTIIPSQNSGLFTNVAPGTYIVRAYDANNCSDDTPVITVVSPPTLSASLDPNSDICYDSTNQATLSVLVSGGTAPFVYSLDGAPAQTSSTFTNVSIGNHTIIVTDSYGCTAPAISITIAPQLTATISNVKELDCTSSPNAVISGSISGGYPPYVVTLISGTGPGIIAQPAATTFTYTTAVASTYQFQIQDSKGCITTTSATINPLVAITATLNPVNPSCNGATDGSVQIIPSGGVGPYTYSIDGTNYVTTSLFTGLAAGDYTFYIKDAKECFITKTITLTQPTTLTTTATVIPFSCSTSNTKQAATITVEIPTTGTAPYLFSINGSAYSTTRTATIYDNGTTQTIPFSVKDANGCTYSDTVTLSALNPPVAGTISTTAITCLVTTSTVTVTPSSGTGVGPLTYEITSPASAITSNTTGEFTGLFPGTYVFKVTDANGCYYIQSHEVLAVTPIAISGNVTSDVLCKGGNTGSAVFTVSGFSGNYNYRIDSGATITGQTAATISLDNYPAGTYTISVTDENTSCTDSATITISEPANALALTATASNINCNNDNAQITVTATGGTLNYGYAAVVASASAPTTYSNSNIVTVDTNSGANLSWDVYVQDANGCTEMTNVTITSDPLPSVTTPPLASNQCTASTAYTFTASGTGGIAPLRYSINGGSTYQNSPTFTVNAPGSYYVTVIDANGCTDISDTPTIVYPKLALSAVLDKVLSCSTPMEAQITLTATNGNSASYTYAYSTDGTNFTDMGSNVFNTTTPGSYTFRVTDANGCTTTTSTAFVLTAPVSPEITGITQTNSINCTGESTAAIAITIDNSKGQSPFVFNVYNNTYAINYGTQTSGLRAGDYTITVTEANGCTDTKTITITEPTPIEINYDITPITCNGAGVSLGAITINFATGGTPNYNYYVTGVNGYNKSFTNNTGTMAVFDVVDFGLYQIIVTDANGCSKIIQNILVASPPDDLDINVNTIADCDNGGTAEVAITSSFAGAGPFYFTIYRGSVPIYPSGTWLPENPAGSKKASFTGLIPGVTYTFAVYDSSTGCTYYETSDAPIPTNSELTIENIIPKNISCKGSADGSVTFEILNPYTSSTDITYEIYNSQSLISTGITGIATVPASGTFKLENIGPLAFGNYFILIKEESGAENAGCSIVSDSFNITESAIELLLTASVSKKANCAPNSGVITAIAKNGTAPYQYQILPDTGIIGDTTDDTAPLADDTNWANSNTFYKDAGDYIVYAMDANECIKAFPIPLDPYAAPTIDTPAPICYDGIPFTIRISGTVDLTIVGGKTYSVNGSAFQSSPDFTFDNPGTYNLVIKDGNGCTATVNYIVYPQLQIEAALTKDLDCSVIPDATITLTATGGNTAPSANYSYESSIDGTNWNSMASNVYTATADGTFYFRVTDNNNPTSCQVQTSLTIDPITPTVFSTIETDVKCNGSNEGTITVNVTSGEGPYEYKLEGPDPHGYQSSNQFNNLIAGTTYIVTVKGRNSCEYASSAITIEQPTALSATSTLTTALSCGTGNAAQEATVTITGINGTTPYTYSYNNGASYTTSETYQSLVGTTFDVWVKDANGCTFVLTNGVNIPALAPPTDMTFDTTSKVTCLAPGTVEITSVTGGTLLLSYAIVFPASAISNNTGASSGIFTGLAPDTYLFQVTDANGCTYQEAYTVDPVTNITVSGLLVNDVNCNSESNGEVQFTVANFTTSYSYTIDGGTTVISAQSDPTITLSGLAAATYTIVVTDETTGCEATASVTVSEPTPLDLTETTNINANCNFGAQVSVTATGGISPYSYSFVPTGDPAVTYTNSASAVLDPNVSTSWDVWVQDSNGCIISSPLLVSIATDPLPTVTVEPYSQCPSGTGEYTFTLTPTGVGPFEYNIGSGYQSSPTFTVNIPGTYDVTVRDKNGCTTTVNGLVSILPALQLEATITALPSCADGDGTLTLTATGGSGNYEYSLDGGAAQSVADFTNITAGSHTATVRDITTNCTFSIQVSLEAATPVTGFALSKTDVSCYGGSDGVITATMDTPAPGINDNPIYMYSLSGAATRAPQQSNIFSGLAPGNYTVMVTSARGCTATATIDIIEPAIITVPAPDVEQFGCTAGTNTTNLATITVNGVTGGSGTYNYEFIKNGNTVQFGTNNTYTEADLLGGNYTVNVYDDKGCMGTAPATITIVPFIALDKITVTVNNPITCTNLEDITVSVSSIGGTPTNLQYAVVDLSGAQVITPNTTGIFTGLNIGSYQITVANLDTGCSVQTIHYVNEPNTFVLNTSNIVDVSCYGGSNGSVAVTIVDTVINTNDPDQSGAFNYTIVDALNNPVTSGVSATAGPITINNLGAGIYTITATLTNSPYCSATTNFTITQPSAELKISETHTEITCVSGNNDGSITATATGGWGGYEFELVGPITVVYSSQSTFTNLTAGTYAVNVKDSKGCIASANVTLVIPTPISITAISDTAMLSCFGDKTATITVTSTSGGQGVNYLYTLNTTSLVPPTSSGPQASPIFSGLGAGTYTVTVTDGYNCSATSTSMVISEPNQINSNLVVANTQSCDNLTTLTLSATGGTGTYTYSDNAAFTTTLGSFTTAVNIQVPPGTYTYYVKDANGCISVKSNDIEITPLVPLTIAIDKTNAVINCAGDNTGVIVATAEGGLGNYSYTLLDGAGATLQGPVASGNFTGLFAEDYRVTVDSGDCNTTSAVITITQPLLPLTATYVITPVSCNGANNGIFTVNATGGTGIIKYAISPNMNQFFDSNIFDNLAPGNYDVVVQDALGCFVLINFDMTEPTPIRATLDASSIDPEVCYGDNDAAFSIDISGGVMPYSVNLDNQTGTYTTGTATQTRFDFTGITGGTHIVYIIDANGCSFELEVPLEESVNIDPVALVDYGCVNNAAANSVTVTVDPSITNPSDLDYSLDGTNYQTSNTFTNLAPGVGYQIYVRHTNGCIKTTPAFNILQVDPLTLILTDGGLNEIVANAAGGGGGYQYTFNGEDNGTKNTYIIYKSGDYTVQVTDVNGCTATVTRYFEYIDVCIPNYFTPNGDGVNDGWAPGCTENYKDLTFDIFDRYGRKIATYHVGEKWDGKYHGNELPSGDYWYVLKLNDKKDNREFVGHFTLYR